MNTERKNSDEDLITSVSQFVDEVMHWSREDELPVAFRGQSFHGWPTKPKIFREDVGLYEHEKNAVRDLVSVHPQEFRHDDTMFDRLVRMQHYELPTRLLDVTTNPLVALYFATDEYRKDDEIQDGKVQGFFLPSSRQRYFDSDRVSCVANLANLTFREKKELGKAYDLGSEEFNEHPSVQRLVWFVRIEKPHFEPKIVPSDLKLPVFVKPKMSNRRIIAQSGAFIIYGARGGIIRRDNGLRTERLLIQANAKKKIRSELERLGIHAGVLFPEIDKAAEFIVKRYSKIEPVR